MARARLSIRIDLANGNRIGVGQNCVARSDRGARIDFGSGPLARISYRGAWQLVKEINQTMRQPAVTAETGGRNGGGAAVTPAGAQIIGLYPSIEARAQEAAADECRAIQRLARPGRTPASGAAPV